LRAPGRAVTLAQKSVDIAPQHGNYLNTLGVAHYRAGDYKAAAVALARSNELFGGQHLAYNGFFLTMAHWRLGHHDEARTWHDRAVQWMDKNKPDDEELRRFRAEAAELLPAVPEKVGQ